MERSPSQWKKLLTVRTVVIGVFIALQLALILAAVIKFSRLYVLYSIISAGISAAFTLYLIRKYRSTAYRLVWTVMILLFPVFGAAVYLMFAGSSLSKDSREKMKRIQAEKRLAVPESSAEYDRGTRYLLASGWPVYADTETVYYPTGEEFYEVLLRELEQAKTSIWMEYFIVSEGAMWDGIHRILSEKAADGVDVRLICDDFGGIGRLPRSFAADLEREGIRCVFFHRLLPVLSALQNNRDHRKICVIDGTAAFTGGINIGDEYIGRTVLFGHWKDSAVMLRGRGAESFSVMFLTMWDYITGERSVVPEAEEIAAEEAGTTQPYPGSPPDEEMNAQNVCLELIGSAEKSLWIMTPYLIPDETTERALIRAARSGVDVRIIVPGIPDKKLVFETTRAHCSRLMECGVRIWEYTPGFLHAKNILADEKTAVIGSINLDYRSFYLQFECGVRMTGTAAADGLRRDFIRTFPVCREITAVKKGFLRSLLWAVLEFLEPLF